MSSKFFACLLFFWLTGCATIQKNFTQPRSATPAASQTTENAPKGQKPSEALAALLAEANAEKPAVGKSAPALPVKTLQKVAAAKTTKKQEPAAVLAQLLDAAKAKDAPPAPVVEKAVAKKTTPPKPSLPLNATKKAAVAPPTPAVIAQDVIQQDAIQAEEATPETLNTLMRQAPKGKVVFAKPDVAAAPTAQTEPPLETHGELPKTSTPVVDPVIAKTSPAPALRPISSAVTTTVSNDPLDTMAAEIAAAPEPPVLPSVTAEAPQKKQKSRGVFIVTKTGTELTLKPETMEKIIAASSAETIPSVDTEADPDNAMLRTRIRRNAYTHGVILESKPVLVPKPLEE